MDAETAMKWNRTPDILGANSGQTKLPAGTGKMFELEWLLGVQTIIIQNKFELILNEGRFFRLECDHTDKMEILAFDDKEHVGTPKQEDTWISSVQHSAG